MSSLGSPKHATQLRGAPKPLSQQLQPRHRDEREEGWRERRSRSCAPFPRRPTLLPHPPSLPSPARAASSGKNTQHGQRRGRQRGRKQGTSRTMWSGSEPNSREPRRRAGGRAAPEITGELGPRGRRGLRPGRAGGVTGTPGSACGQDGADRSGAAAPSAPERDRRRDSPAFWSRGQR